MALTISPFVARTDTLLADLQATGPREKTTAPVGDGDANGHAIGRHTAPLVNGRGRSNPPTAHTDNPPSPPSGTNLAALDSLLESLNAFSDADLQLDTGE